MVAAALVLVLAAAPPAVASDITVDGPSDTLTFTGGPGEGNGVHMTDDPVNGCPAAFDPYPCIGVYDSAGIDSFPADYCLWEYGPQSPQFAFCFLPTKLVVNLGDGNDSFAQYEFDSVVNGGPGNDELLGYGGDDVLNGDSGNDQISGGAGNDTVNAGDGNDELEAKAADPPSSAGTDVLNGGPGDDKLDYVLRDDGLAISLDGVANDGGADNDNVGSDIETVRGGTGADTLVGNDGPNRLEGFNGNDQIFGRGGDDYVYGDSGDDRVNGESGTDEVRGGNGSDGLDGGPGTDQFFGDDPCTIWSCYGGSDTVSARDGFVDSISCGIAADSAVVDHNDVVATDFQQNCETVDRGAVPQPPPVQPPPVQPPPVQPQPVQPKPKPVTTPKPKRKLVTICHRGRTLKVTKKQLKKHLRHGDKRGACKRKKR